MTDVMRAYYDKALRAGPMPDGDGSFISYCNGVGEGFNKALKVLLNRESVRALKDE